MNPYPQVVHRLSTHLFLLFLTLCAISFAVPAHAAVLIEDNYTDYDWEMPTLTSDNPRMQSNGWTILNQNTPISSGQAGVSNGYAIYTDDAAHFISVVESNQGPGGAFTIFECTVPFTLGSGGIGCSGSSSGFGSMTLSASGDNHYVIATFSSPFTLVSGRYYAVAIGSPGSTLLGHNTHLIGTSGGSCFTNWAMTGTGGGQIDCPDGFNAAWVQVFGTAFEPPTPDDTTTRIDITAPYDNEPVATSSLPYDFEAIGYINDDDYGPGARVKLKVDRNTDQQAQGALLAFDSAFGNTTYLPIGGPGAFDVATSSDNLNLDFPIREGLYSARWAVESPTFNIFGFSLFYSSRFATSTRFVVGTTTGIDNIQLDQEDYLNSIINSSGDPLASCQFSFFDTAMDFSLGGNLLRCMGGILHWMFILPPGVLESTMTQLKDGFLTRAPWGYFTRIVSSISGGAEATLPTVHVDVPIPHTNDNTSGEIQIEFDVDQMIEDSATLGDSFQAPNGDTAQEIIEPIIQLIVGLLVLMFIWNDIHSALRRI